MIFGISIIEFLVYAVLSIIVATLFVSLFISNRKRAALATAIAILSLEKESLLSMLEKEMKKKEDNSIEKTDGFLKFVSDSRDWAFKYIEEVQAALESFKSAVDLDIKYIVKYGQLIDHPLQDSINKIAGAYTELQKVLPQDKDQV